MHNIIPFILQTGGFVKSYYVSMVFVVLNVSTGFICLFFDKILSKFNNRKIFVLISLVMGLGYLLIGFATGLLPAAFGRVCGRAWGRFGGGQLHQLPYVYGLSAVERSDDCGVECIRIFGARSQHLFGSTLICKKRLITPLWYTGLELFDLRFVLYGPDKNRQHEVIHSSRVDIKKNVLDLASLEI